MKLSANILKLIPLALGVMSAVEKLYATRKGKSEEKSEAYVEALMTALGITESVTNKDMINDEKFRKLMKKFADTVIEVNNFVEEYKSHA